MNETNTDHSASIVADFATSKPAARQDDSTELYAEMRDELLQKVEKRRAYHRAYYANNRKKLRDRAKQWRDENPEKVKTAWKRWRQENPDAYRAIVKRSAERARAKKKTNAGPPELATLLTL